MKKTNPSAKNRKASVKRNTKRSNRLKSSVKDKTKRRNILNLAKALRKREDELERAKKMEEFNKIMSSRKS